MAVRCFSSDFYCTHILCVWIYTARLVAIASITVNAVPYTACGRLLFSTASRCTLRVCVFVRVSTERSIQWRGELACCALHCRFLGERYLVTFALWHELSVCPSVVCLWRCCTLRDLNFSAIVMHHLNSDVSWGVFCKQAACKHIVLQAATWHALALLLLHPLEWNSLPADIRLCDNILTFKRHLKTHLFILT